MRNIDIFVPPIEPLVVWRGAFTPEQCDDIIQHGELAEFKKGTVGRERLDEKVRDTDVTWIQPIPEAKWIFEQMNQLMAKINFDKFQMDLSRFDGFQYGRYEAGGHYDWHIDTVNEPPHGLFRKLSLSLMLTEPDAYEGGELLLATGGNWENAHSLKPSKGDLAVFYSHVPHKVSPVTSGERITLVTWALGPKLK